ncbi:MAG TPA: dephospho-CoA kinase [Candidatus Limnocylindrales bacterium]|nr:dephospho-CoA kinase [Candidatus Limnocylindrales bacterium]
MDAARSDPGTPAGAAAAAPRPFMIGLTGPIGCGKSTVARMLGELGGTVIDADVLARRATEPGRTALPAIRKRFGDAVFAPDGTLVRSALAAVVFDDGPALRDLEAIVHPEVRRLVEAELAAAQAAEAPLVIVEAIKLIEGGLADRCDEVWLVECEPSTQRQRLAGRGAADADIERRLSAQGANLADRLAEALANGPPLRRLTTEGSVDETRSRVEDALADALAPLLLDLD